MYKYETDTHSIIRIPKFDWKVIKIGVIYGSSIQGYLLLGSYYWNIFLRQKLTEIRFWFNLNETQQPGLQSSSIRDA